MSEAAKHYAVLFSIVVVTALVLSVGWHIPYVFTLIVFSAWAFFGHLVTADDDAPGGWSNPDGSQPFPWRELAIKGIIFVCLCVVAALVPAVRNFGGVS
jgi:hypothetical protein